MVDVYKYTDWIQLQAEQVQRSAGGRMPLSETAASSSRPAKTIIPRQDFRFYFATTLRLRRAVYS